MAEFLEERLPFSVRAGASYSDEYAVEITRTASGAEFRRLVHPYPIRVYNIAYTQHTADLWAEILSLYHRAYGMFSGFRVKAMDDYTTNNLTGSPTAFDQVLALVSSGVYQLQVAYGVGSAISIGKPYRTIFKPVAGSVKVAIGAAEQSTRFSVSSVNGRVTFTDYSKTITGVTKAAQAVVSVGSHTFNVNDSVYISGISGMVQINDKRAFIVAKDSSSITVDINSSAYSTYTSGGVIHTAPQTGEVVYGGCEFDIPCRFNSRVDVTHLAPYVRESSQIEIIELLNP